jgi:UDP-N-acetylglucosamine acyltransferase
VLHPSARIHPSATIGPFCLVGADVDIGAQCVLRSHVVVDGRTRIGAGTVVFPHTALGTRSEDKKHDGAADSLTPGLTIGADCVVRENVTINCGTAPDRGGDPLGTRIGHGVLLQASVHVGHDCWIGDGAVLSAGASLAGHVHVGDRATLGGMCGVQQRARVGAFAMVGGASAVDGDVIPYGLVAGNRATLRGVNLVGLRRAGRSMFTLEQIKFLMAAQRYLFPAVSGSNGGVGGGDGGGCHPQRSSLVPCPFVLPWHDLLEERAGELTGAIKGGLRLGEGRDGVAGDRGSEEHRNEIKLALDVLLAIRGRKKVLMASGV